MNFFVFCLLLFSFFTFYLTHGNFCPDLKTAIKFESFKMRGVWYAVGHTNKNYVDEVKCITVDFQYKVPENALVEWRGINKSDGKKNELTGIMLTTPYSKVCREILFEKTSTIFKTQDNNITILGTDHKTYLIAYACYEDKKQYYSWIITKESKMPFSLFREILSIVSNNGIDFEIYNVIDRNDCSK